MPPCPKCRSGNTETLNRATGIGGIVGTAADAAGGFAPMLPGAEAGVAIGLIAGPVGSARLAASPQPSNHTAQSLCRR